MKLNEFQAESHSVTDVSSNCPTCWIQFILRHKLP